MKRILFVVLLFLMVVPIGYYFLSDKSKTKPLPVINPIDVQQEMVDPEMLRIGRGHKVGTFRFENQDGTWITDADMKGKVSVVEYFFTSCKSICPIMNSQMQRIQRKFAKQNDLRIFSFTVDPDIDTVAQMKRYALAHQAKAGQWHFLTGKKLICIAWLGAPSLCWSPQRRKTLAMPAAILFTPTTLYWSIAKCAFGAITMAPIQKKWVCFKHI